MHKRIMTVLFSMMIIPALSLTATADVETDADQELPPEDLGPVIDMEASFPDENLRQFIQETFDSNDDEQISSGEIDKVRLLDVSGEGIKDISGLGLFKSLTELHLEKNELTSVDLSSLGGLLKLNISGNPIETVDLSPLPYLTSLDVSDTGIKAADLSANPNLTAFKATGNGITYMDMSAAKNLRHLDLSDNDLTAVNLTGNPMLTSLDLSSNDLTTINLKSNKRLKEINVASNELQILDLSHNRYTEEISCDNNGLTELKLGSISKVKIIEASGNSLKTLKLRHNKKLERLVVNDNELKSIDFGSKLYIKYIDVRENRLKTLNTRDMISVTYINCSGNRISSVDLRRANQGLYFVCTDNKVKKFYRKAGQTVDCEFVDKEGNIYQFDTSEDLWSVGFKAPAEGKSKIVIPASVNAGGIYPVKRIEKTAFEYDDTVKTVVIRSALIGSCGKRAFASSSVKKFVLPAAKLKVYKKLFKSRGASRASFVKG